MNQIRVASILLLISFALGIVYFIVTMVSNNRLDKQERCAFRNSYPYNFYMNSSLPIRAIQYFTLLVSILCGAIGEAFFFAAYDISTMYFLMALFPIAFICLFISNILSLNYYRSHLILSSVSFVLFSIASIILSFHTIICQFAPEPKIYIPILVLSGLLGFSGLLSLANPKLFSWAKMNKTEENGKTYYVKPKWNFYAFYEWIFLLMQELMVLMLFINIIINDAVAA